MSLGAIGISQPFSLNSIYSSSWSLGSQSILGHIDRDEARDGVITDALARRVLGDRSAQGHA
jgi:hypothetical protein